MWSKDADVENILSRDKEMRLFLFNSLYSCICGRLSSQLGQLGKKGVNFSRFLIYFISINYGRIYNIKLALDSLFHDVCTGKIRSVSFQKLTKIW